MTSETISGTTSTTPATTEAEPSERLSAREQRAESGGSGRRRWPFSTLRARILFWYVGLLAFAILASVLVARQVLLIRLDERLDRELMQESREVRRLAGGVDPATSEPFGPRVERIFEVFLERNVPSRNEAFLTFVEGEPFLRSRVVVPYRLDQDPALIARWSLLRESDRGRVETPAGGVEYLAVPLRFEGETSGVFVVALFRDFETDELNGAIIALGAVGFAVLLIGSALAWRLAGGVLRPVRAVTSTARSISQSDLSQRIDVAGRDEVAELAQTFNQMLDRLEASFATQRRFLDDASHELKTPITIIRGHLELLGDDPHERRETVALVLDELDRMSRIVNDLLLLAKADQPDFLNLEPVDVESITADLHTKVSALAERNWRLESHGRGSIVADRQRLTQAVVQLAQNAVQHSAEGDPVGLGSAVEGGEARFWVRDRGSGIAPEEQARIFERFARGREAARVDGAGLGLSIVKAIADAHGGRVELHSRPGAGAMFTLVLPADQPPSEAGRPR